MSLFARLFGVENKPPAPNAPNENTLREIMERAKSDNVAAQANFHRAAVKSGNDARLARDVIAGVLHRHEAGKVQ